MSDQRQRWDAFLACHTSKAPHEDIAWSEFKALHGFNPRDFEVSPPWCEAGARNNSWAASAFLGDARREKAWAMAGYFDRPFHFAYLWLDLTGFNGLRGNRSLPYTARHTQAEMRREAQRLARAVERLNAELSKWPFCGELGLSKLVKDSDYTNSVTLPGGSGFTEEQLRIASQVMFAGARQELNLPGAGSFSLLARMAEALDAWRPPETLIDRPRRPGARPRFAARWLDRAFESLGGSIPPSARYHLIAELIQILAELGQWDDEPWVEEEVRRSLDGKSTKGKRVSD